LMLHWQSDVRPLLTASTVSKIREQLAESGNVTDAGIQAFTSYAIRLDAFRTEYIRRRFAERRDVARTRLRFVMELLMKRRNDIVHEAITLGPDAQIYARALEQVLESVLKQLLTLTSVGHVHDIGDALVWCATPWLQ
jgi:hypothetical protein